MLPSALSKQNITVEDSVSAPRNPAWQDKKQRLSDVIALQQVFNHTFINTMTHMGLHASLLPITTHSVSSPMAVGSDSSPVKISLFGVPTYLSDSMQFLLEYACRFTPKGSYYMMPSFRGEPADARHLSQFYHAEAEIPGELDDVIALVEMMTSALCRAFLDSPYAHLVHNPTVIEQQIQQAFPRMSVDEAAKALDNAPEHVVQKADGCYITSDGEKILLEKIGQPFWLTRHYASLVPFYQKTCPDAPHLTQTADLIMGIGETVGAGARHVTGSDVRKALFAQQVLVKNYQWYVDMKEEDPIQTAGFGMGVERFLCWITGETDIRHFEICPRRNGEVCIP